MKMHHVYVVTHRASLRHYVGKTSRTPDVRWKQHLKDAVSRPRACPMFHRAMRKYGPESFTWQVVESFDSESEALFFEAWWIRFLESFRRTHGFNIYMDGTGGIGHPVSAETRDKLRAANLGKKASAETRAKLSAVHLGRPRGPVSEETRRLISEARKRELAQGTRVSPTLGVGHSEEARAKMRKPKKLSDEQRDAIRKRASSKMREMWMDPDYRAKRAAQAKERLELRWQDPEYRTKMTLVNRKNNEKRHSKSD